MEEKETKHEQKETYVEPKVIATYEKEELEEAMKPEGINFEYTVNVTP
jgi:hypothetical protein